MFFMINSSRTAFKSLILILLFYYNYILLNKSKSFFSFVVNVHVGGWYKTLWYLPVPSIIQLPRL